MKILDKILDFIERGEIMTNNGIVSIFDKMFDEIVDEKKYPSGSSSEIEVVQDELTLSKIYTQKFLFENIDKKYEYIATVITDLQGNIKTYEYKILNE